MRIERPRQSVLSLRVTNEYRRVIEKLAKKMSSVYDRRVTMTDVIEEAVKRLAASEGITK